MQRKNTIMSHDRTIDIVLWTSSIVKGCKMEIGLLDEKRLSGYRAPPFTICGQQYLHWTPTGHASYLREIRGIIICLPLPSIVKAYFEFRPFKMSTNQSSKLRKT